MSGRNDLVSEFIRELIGTIKSKPKLTKRLKGLIEVAARYGAQLAPVANFALPVAGTAAQSALTLVQNTLSVDQSLTGLRAQLLDKLEELDVPLVVLIDELDRIENSEIRTIAQLVRSVADFPGISYVLAYDVDRVIQALGSDASDTEKYERGKSYLEKIVQLQIPLPVSLENERSALLSAELQAIEKTGIIATQLGSDQRYKNLQDILLQNVILTPRDIKRLTGTFRALAGMVGTEVNCVDLLAYSALLTKAPQTVEKIKLDPDSVVDNPVSIGASFRRFGRNPPSSDQLVTEIVPANEMNTGIQQLLRFLFPALGGTSNDLDCYTDTLRLRRPLLTTLRLGLLPGDIPKSKIHEFLALPKDKAIKELKLRYEDGSMGVFVDRINDIYFSSISVNHNNLWLAVSEFVERKDFGWLTHYCGLHHIAQDFEDILRIAVRRNARYRDPVREAFEKIYASGSNDLTSRVIHRHLFIYGLFGRREQFDEGWFIDKGTIEIYACKKALGWKEHHLKGRLIPSLWSLHPYYVTQAVGAWDHDCRSALEHSLHNDNAVDGLSLLLFGGNYATDMSSIEEMCSYKIYKTRVEQRVSSHDFEMLDESLQRALRKALGNFG